MSQSEVNINRATQTAADIAVAAAADRQTTPSITIAATDLSPTATATTGTSTESSPITTTVSPIDTTQPATQTSPAAQDNNPSAPSTTTMASTVSPDGPSHAPIDPTRLSGYVVVLDPGHQAKGNREQEPVSPGSLETKDKVTSGTAGIVTGRPESVVNLEISLMLKDFLESQGCTVYMTRETQDVNLSNIERAQFALAKEPDVYLRLHGNGSADQNQQGIGIYVADTGIYTDQLPAWGQWLADELCEATGADNQGVDASSRYSGLNWATDIPSFLVEMGYMTNPEEDRLLSDPAYQANLCQGFADFIARMPRRG